jgi:hypothetical protein
MGTLHRMRLTDDDTPPGAVVDVAMKGKGDVAVYRC